MDKEKMNKAIVMLKLFTNSEVYLYRIIISIGMLLFVLNSLGQIVPASSLTTQNDKLLFQNSLYTGQVLDYFNNEQLKSKYSVIDGVLTGVYEIYHFDNSFNKSVYKDTALISDLTREINEYENRLIKLESDKSMKTTELNDFITYSIGGVKKLDKLKLKEAKDKLNKKQKSLYNEYISKHNLLVQIETEISRFSGKLKKLGETLKIEKSKPLYLNRKSSIIHYKNGQRNGAYEEIANDGFVFIKGIYKNGLMDGEWVYFFKNKQKKAIGLFLSGDGENLSSSSGIPINGRNGEWIFYYENGNKSQIGSFVNGKEEGEFIYYHDNGHKSIEKYYKNGVLHGLHNVYYKNGQLESEGQYVNGIMEGKWKFYYENGQLKQDGAFESGRLNGLVVLFHENGNIDKEVNWKNGVQDGGYKHYHENGKIAKKGTMLNGKDNGLIKSFYENGNPELEAFFIKGTAHGPVKSYHSNGKLKMKSKVDSTSLADGGIYGDSYVYKEDGALSAHIFVEKDGTFVDKMKKNNTPTNTGKKTSHNCSWCGRNFKGLGYTSYSPGGLIWDAECKAMQNIMDWDEIGFSKLGNFWICSQKCAIEECWSKN